MLYVEQNAGIPYDSDASVASWFAQDPGWKEVTARLGGSDRLVVRRAFQSDPQALRRFVDEAQKSAEQNGVRGYRRLEFDRYFLVYPRDERVTDLTDLYCGLRSNSSFRGTQVFLNTPSRPSAASIAYTGSGSPRGVGAIPRLAGQTPQDFIDGSGQVLVDIEYAWHESLPLTPLPVANNGNPVVESGDVEHMSHGTSVASIILGSGAADSAYGIAPKAALFKGSCWYHESSSAPPPRDAPALELLASTVMAAGLLLDQLRGGTGKGVLLLECQSEENLPVERNPLVQLVIQQLAARGHIVIEPAGNGAMDLDVEMAGYRVVAVGTPAGQPSPAAGQWPDSGAILVAAANSGNLDNAIQQGEISQSSNSGSRVDCWAWGDSIAARGVVGAPGSTSVVDLTAGFSDTSGAAAIIAGVVLLIQQLRASAGKLPLTPGQLRDLLRNPPGGIEGIGLLAGRFMPDLSKDAMRSAILQLPDVGSVAPPSPLN